MLPLSALSRLLQCVVGDGDEGGGGWGGGGGLSTCQVGIIFLFTQRKFCSVWRMAVCSFCSLCTDTTLLGCFSFLSLLLLLFSFLFFGLVDFKMAWLRSATPTCVPPVPQHCHRGCPQNSMVETEHSQPCFSTSLFFRQQRLWLLWFVLAWKVSGASQHCYPGNVCIACHLLHLRLLIFGFHPQTCSLVAIVKPSVFSRS